MPSQQKREQVQTVHIPHENSAKVCTRCVWHGSLVGDFRSSIPGSKHLQLRPSADSRLTLLEIDKQSVSGRASAPSGQLLIPLHFRTAGINLDLQSDPPRRSHFLHKEVPLCICFCSLVHFLTTCCEILSITFMLSDSPRCVALI